MPRYELDGQAAIVTGAGRGIGRATALRLAHEGASITVADIDEANANRGCRRNRVIRWNRLPLLQWT